MEGLMKASLSLIITWIKLKEIFLLIAHFQCQIISVKQTPFKLDFKTDAYYFVSAKSAGSKLANWQLCQLSKKVGA